MKKFQVKVYDSESITFLESKQNVSEFVRNCIEKVMKGKLEETDDIDYKLKRAKLLKLNLECWDKLREKGFLLDEAKAIMLNEKDLEEPSLKYVKQTDSPALCGLIDGMCTECKHRHSHYEPRVCVHGRCNCGIRG